MSSEHEIRQLEQVAEAGVSDETPLVLIGFNIVLWASVVLTLTAVTLVAWRLATI